MSIKKTTEFNQDEISTKLLIVQRLATAKAQIQLAQLNNKRVQVDEDLVFNLEFLIAVLTKLIDKLT